jgi:hypothetical protein
MFPPPGAHLIPRPSRCRPPHVRMQSRENQLVINETIAKHILALASEGERGPHRLRQGALALSVRKSRSA